MDDGEMYTAVVSILSIGNDGERTLRCLPDQSVNRVPVFVMANGSGLTDIGGDCIAGGGICESGSQDSLRCSAAFSVLMSTGF
jgi:hypothetical protein